jgi:hypothetical protein
LDCERDVGFELGWDFAHHGLTPPTEHLHPLSSVRQGWEAGRECFGQRTLKAERFARKWLQLRANAWARGRAFDTLQVTPAFLRRIDVALCPVTRERLTHATGAASDASVDRLHNGAAYAAGNLAVMSTGANRAKGTLGFAALHSLAHRLAIEAKEGSAPASMHQGLSAAAWARLATLASFVHVLPHGQAAALPLHVLPPPRVRLQNPVQALQVLLSLQFTRVGHARRCAALSALMPDAATRYAFNAFMHTLLARRLAQGRIDNLQAEREAIEDLWADALVQRRWQRLALALDATRCEAIVETAIRQGLAGSAVQWLPQDIRTETWALATNGYEQAQACAESAHDACDQAQRSAARAEPGVLGGSAVPASWQSAPASPGKRASGLLAGRAARFA